MSNTLQKYRCCFLVLSLLLGINIFAFSQISSDRNFVTAIVINKPGITTPTQINALDKSGKIQQVNYFDGLGRLIQKIDIQASPEGKDIISSVTYDAYDREVTKYLSYPDQVSTAYGSFRSSGFSDQKNFYNSDAAAGAKDINPYSQTFFEFSPLSSPLETGAAGQTWQPGSGHTIKPTATFNTIADAVKKWAVTNITNDFGSYAVTGVYAANTLTKTIITDENGKEIIEFKDLEGKVILKKVQLNATPDNKLGNNNVGWLCTYYIYDDFNNLRAVLQPKAVQAIDPESGSVLNWQLDASVLNELCFRYEYDERGRMIEKKVPGADEVYMIYDARDRLVMTQDANMRNSGKWMVTVYDNSLNRPVQTGLIMNSAIGSKTAPQHRAAASVSIAYPFTSPPANGWELLTMTHYDDYNNLPSGFTPAINTSFINSDNFMTTYSTAPDYAEPLIQSMQTRGMITYTQVKVLGTTAQFLTTLNIYDEKGRIIQVETQNITGGVDVVTNQYNFSGELIRTHINHEKQGNNPQTYQLGTRNTYDDMGRLIKIEKKTTTYWKVISKLTYNELGQLKTKKIGTDPGTGNTPLETLNYDYNIRGWLLGVNRDYAKSTTSNTNKFGFDLGYDQTNIQSSAGVSIGTYADNQYNGNITGTIWKSVGDGQIRKYDFTYDAVNRFKGAQFKQYSIANHVFDLSDGIDFSVSALTYDGNGNILSMKQKGFKLGGSNFIDNLTYNYNSNSNKLKNVTDAANDATTQLGDFRYSNSYTASLPGAKPTTATDYTYDINGNLITDKNKDISPIIYNYLNLAQNIAVTGKGSIEYVYDATGNKLKKIVHETNRPDKTTLYLFGIYENDTLQFLPQEEGRIRTVISGQQSSVSYVYDYFIKDQLGNIRMVLTEEQQKDNYPTVTLESKAASLATEKLYYNIIDDNIVDESTIPSFNGTTTNEYQNNNGNPPYNNNPDANVTANSQKLYKLRATTTGGVTGLGITLKVMSGDKIDIFGKSYYFENTAGSNSGKDILLTDILAGMLGTTGGMAASHGATVPLLTSGANPTVLPASILSHPVNTGDLVPKAYINYILFDEQFKYVASGFARVGNQNELTPHTLGNIAITKSGYIYIYCSNESKVDVFFDNLQVIHTRGPLLEETHYYPFGLTMAGISSKSAGKIQNKYGITGKEIQNKEFSDGSGLELYDFDARMYDQQIDHFPNIDSHADKFPSLSPYVYVADNSINCVDPDGKEWVQVNGQMMWDDRVTNQETASQYYGESSIYRAPGFEWENKLQGCITLGNNAEFTMNGNSMIALNATPAIVGAAIMKGGFETFTKYLEAFGSDYFFNAANRNYNDNATGLMAFFKENMDGVGDGIKLSQMTHDWVASGSGWTEEKNQLEHQMGMFLMAEKYGPERAQTIGTLNEWRGLLINDRQSGNVKNAIDGRGGTAFEWKDLEHNKEGIEKWYKYHGLPTPIYPQPGTLEFEMVR